MFTYIIFGIFFLYNIAILNSVCRDLKLIHARIEKIENDNGRKAAIESE